MMELLLLLWGTFLLPAMILWGTFLLLAMILGETVERRKLESAPEYKKGCRDGYMGTADEYKRFEKFVNMCADDTPERKYARGYMCGYTNKKEEDSNYSKRVLCKSERDFISKKINMEKENLCVGDEYQ